MAPSTPSSSQTSGPVPAAPVIMAEPYRPRLKVSSPDTFSGDRKKLRAFLAQLELYIRFNSAELNQESKKTLFAATYLRDAAFDWFEPYLTDFLENEPPDRKDETDTLFANYSAFKAKLKSVYGSVDEERTAERDIQKLQQVTSVTKYTSEFQQLSSRLEWDDSALAAKYYHGLKENIKDEIARTERPSELKDLVDLAAKIDNRLYERQLERGQQRRTVFHTNIGKRQAPTPIARGTYPIEMELDATHFKKGRKLSKAQKEERMKKNLCLYCGKPGHQAKECKSKHQLNATFANHERGRYDVSRLAIMCELCNSSNHFTRDCEFRIIPRVLSRGDITLVDDKSEQTKNVNSSHSRTREESFKRK